MSDTTTTTTTNEVNETKRVDLDLDFKTKYGIKNVNEFEYKCLQLIKVREADKLTELVDDAKEYGMEIDFGEISEAIALWGRVEVFNKFDERFHDEIIKSNLYSCWYKASQQDDYKLMKEYCENEVLGTMGFVRSEKVVRYKAYMKKKKEEESQL